MSNPRASQWERGFRETLDRAGFDLVHPFDLALYNADASVEHRLHDFGRPHARGLLVANTRALWPPFVRAVRDDAVVRASADPLECHLERTLHAAVVALPFAARAYLSHVVTPRPVPIQQISQRAHFAPLGPCHLCIHPEYGPWFALRAVVVCDHDAAIADTTEPPHPCAGCERPCVRALKIALDGGPATRDGVRAGWRRWAEVRTVCPLGRAHRYDDPQLEYHYTARREIVELKGIEPSTS